jgi:peptide/nickel transport system permease protein
MSTVTVPSAAALKVPGFWRRALHHRSFVIGAVLTLLLLLAAGVSLVWTPWSPYDMDMANKLKPPSGSHWLGTDTYGRDVGSLLLVGARASILVGVIAVGIGLVVGTALGCSRRRSAAGSRKPSCGSPTSRSPSPPSCRPSC